MAIQEKKLERLPDEGVISGVSAGVAEYVGIDTTLVRIIFVVASLFAGFPIIVYIALWIFLPVREGTAGVSPPMPSDGDM